MSLQIAAQHLASKGRGPDTELVHMTKGEIAGLHALALSQGGKLTINPDTGLVEAGFLSAILPMIAGFALGPAGFGLMSSLGAAATVGGLTGLATGSLSKGLSAGLGAYGGSGIGESLAGMGATGMEGLTGSTTGAEFNNLLTSNANPAVSPLTGFDAATAGAQNVFSSPSSALNFAKGNLSNIGMAAAPIASSLLAPSNPAAQATRSPGLIRPSNLTVTQRPEAYAAQPYGVSSPYEQTYFNNTYTAGKPYEAPGPEYRTAANGGYVAQMADGGVAGDGRFPQSDMPQVDYSSSYQQPIQENVLNNAPQTRVDPNTGSPLFAQGGIASLGSYSDGGQLLKGPGDGVSDNIPAVIGKSQPARLADGEFVVPARIVSEIGNGSTDAGARELYKMMARIQKSRNKTVGKDKVAVDAKARNLLPA